MMKLYYYLTFRPPRELVEFLVDLEILLLAPFPPAPLLVLALAVVFSLATFFVFSLVALYFSSSSYVVADDGRTNFAALENVGVDKALSRLSASSRASAWPSFFFFFSFIVPVGTATAAVEEEEDEGPYRFLTVLKSSTVALVFCGMLRCLVKLSIASYDQVLELPIGARRKENKKVRK